MKHQNYLQFAMVFLGICIKAFTFIIYINDIINSSKDCKFISFADDTNIFVTGETEQHVFDRANEVLKNVYLY